jgi:hypothetical protein
MVVSNDIYREYESFRDTIGVVVAGVSITYQELHSLRDEAESLIARINEKGFSESREILVGQMLTIVSILTEAISHRNVKKAFD